MLNEKTVASLETATLQAGDYYIIERGGKLYRVAYSAG